MGTYTAGFGQDSLASEIAASLDLLRRSKLAVLRYQHLHSLFKFIPLQNLTCPSSSPANCSCSCAAMCVRSKLYA